MHARFSSCISFATLSTPIWLKRIESAPLDPMNNAHRMSRDPFCLQLNTLVFCMADLQLQLDRPYIEHYQIQTSAKLVRHKKNVNKSRKLWFNHCNGQYELVLFVVHSKPKSPETLTTSSCDENTSSRAVHTLVCESAWDSYASAVVLNSLRRLNSLCSGINVYVFLGIDTCNHESIQALRSLELSL